MRDPARIDRMIEKLRVLWHSSPDQRLGQLKAAVTMDIEETYRDDEGWVLTAYFLGTIKEAPPGWWQRLKNWFSRKPLPEARVISGGKP